MKNKKKAAPHGTAPKKSGSKNTTSPPVLSAREARLLANLLRSPDGISREAVDRATPASNGPHYIEQLRRKLGLQIPCRRVDFVTKDGEPSWYGHYSLGCTDRQKLKRGKGANG